MVSNARAVEVALCAELRGRDAAAKAYKLKPESVDRFRRIANGLYAVGGEVLAGSTGKHSPRVLVFDIETAPSLAYIWKCYDECITPAQMREHTVLLSWAAKWLDQPEVMVDSAEGDADDRRLCETIWKLFDEADVVVAHNGQAFDVRSLNTRWAQYGMIPPSPVKVVDTLKIAKERFRFGINKLDYIARFFGIGKKNEHEGFELWLKCMAGDKDAWERMRQYNSNDVIILEGVYLKLRAWDQKHPNVAIMYSDEIRRCTVCGSAAIKELPQAAFTGVSVFQSYRCDNCGKVMRGWKADSREKPLRNAL